MSERKLLPVTLHIAVDPETGETWVVRPDTYWDDELRMGWHDLEDTLATERAKGATEEIIHAGRIQTRERMTQITDQWRARHAQARQTAQVHQFALRKPNYGDVMTARGAATTSSGFDTDVYGLELLRGSLCAADGSDAPSIHSLDPVIAQELTARLLAMVHPSPRRLILFARPSSAEAATPAEPSTLR